MRFNDIPGHESVKERLKALADSGRIPHALLIHGPAGIGKLAMARAFMQYVNCRNHSADGDSCGLCPTCRKMQSHNLVDLSFTYPVVKTDSAKGPVSEDFFDEWKEFLDSDPYNDFDAWADILGRIKANSQPAIYVSESQELIKKLSYASRNVRYKALILWLPERLNLDAANKLLKLIEEPYEDTIIIMVSNDYRSILPTIFSRVQRIEMKRLPDATVAQWLANRHGVEHSDAMAIAHNAEGSVTKAVRALTVDNDNKKFLDLFIQLMRLAYQRNVSALRDWSAELSGLGREKELKFYAYCQRMIRENFILNFSVPKLNYLSREEAAFSKNFARFITERNVEKIITVLNNASIDVAGNANGKIVNFDLAIKIIMLLKQ